jgi:adenine-specific DNA-methyltransferase
MPTLDWLHRDAAFRTAQQVPTRVLRPHAAGHRFGSADGAPGNLLVQGDNLQALKALLPLYRGQVKCIFIDPPYNTKSAFEHYDDNEGHYLKVLMDEVSGRGNFVANAVWRSSDNSNNDAKTFSTDHNQLLVYAKAPGWLPKKLDSVDEKRSHFKNPDNDPRGPWFDGNPFNSPKPPAWTATRTAWSRAPSS